MERFVIKTRDELKEFLLDFTGNIAFDTETTSLIFTELELEGVSLCNGRKACYIDFTCLDDEAGAILDLRDMFHKATSIIAHNIVFDMKVLYKYGITFDGYKIYDTMVADHLIDERREHGLKALAKNLLGKEETISWKEARAIGGDTFIEYATNDAIWTHELCIYQQPFMREQEVGRLFREIEMPFQFVLLEMAIEGVNVDIKEMEKTQKELTKEVESLTIEMLGDIDEKFTMQMTIDGDLNVVSPIDFNSPQQVGHILFERLGLPVIERTDSGKPSTGKKTINALKSKHPFVETLNKYKICQKLLSSFFIPIPKLVESDGKVRPNFRDIGTKTGRLSCNNPNLQQLPKPNSDFPVDTRKCFIVPKGYKMITCDYSGQELRVLTQITQEPVLIDTFNKGKDMHLSTANDFFELGISEEDLYENSPKVEHYKKKFKEERNKAKIINFGMAYGKKAWGFSQDFGISEEEAQEILDKYFAALPKVKEAIDKCHKQVTDQGYVTSLTGRRRRFDRVEKNGWEGYPQKAYRESFNFLIQGFSADMMRLAMNKVIKERKEEWDLKTIATVHDEAVYKVKEEHLEEASQYIKDCFETAVKFCIPVVADLGVGNNYGEAK